MKCDQALDALATGGVFRRWLAARHLARCPKCSEQAAGLRQIVEALSDVPPLTESQRQSWMKAADEAPLVSESPGWHALAKCEHGSTRTHAHTSREHATRPILRGVAGVLLLISLFYSTHWFTRHLFLPQKPPIIAAIDPIVIKQTTLRDLDTLQVKSSSLSRELDDLLCEVDLLDARRDVEALQLQLASLGERRGP
jgi:hypothetical protein